MRLAGRLLGRQPLQRRGVVRGRVGYGDLHAGTEVEIEKLLLGFVNPRQCEFQSCILYSESLKDVQSA